MKIELNRDWSEFLCALIVRRVRFVLVGGHAVAGHGEPRLTEDLDVFVDPSLANATRLREALVVIGLQALIKNKKAAGRPKDLFDVALLEALAPPRPARRRPVPPPRKRTR